MSTNIRKIEIQRIQIVNIIYRLYDIVLTLYLFSHLALGWDERFVIIRRGITFLLLGLSLCVFCIRVKQNRGLLKINYVHIWVIVYFSSCLISCVGSPVFIDSLKTALTFLLGLYLVVTINERYKDRDDLWKLLSCMVISAFLSGFFILYESGFALEYGRLGFTENSNNIINSLSNFCAFGAVMNVAFIVKSFVENLKLSFILYMLYEVILVYTVLRTGSRTGMIILLLGTVMVVYLSTCVTKTPLFFVLVILAGIIVFSQFISTELFQVMYKRGFENIYKILVLGKTVNDGSIEIRLEMISYGLNCWLDRPIFGWGLGSFESLAGFGFYSHCDYIELIFGIGLFGMSLYYSLNFTGMLRLNRYKNTGDVLLAAAFTVGFLMFLAGLSSVSYTSLSTMIYMLIVYKVGELIKSEQKKKQYLIEFF